jgi:hypothetical protein
VTRGFAAAVRAGLRQAPQRPQPQAGLSWWATKDRASLNVEAAERARTMSRTREGRSIVPRMLD